MRSLRAVLTAFPSFLAGVAAAVTLETSAGVLLYVDEGFLPALTLILTVEVGSLALGLWAGQGKTDGDAIEQVRRRWLFSLIAFAMAAALAAGLGFMGRLPDTALGQGVGVGLLGALPLFGIGSVFGAMHRIDGNGGRSLSVVGAPAVLGASVGFLLGGGVLLPHAAPYTVYFVCMVVLSGGALLQGRALDARSLVEILEVVPASTGELRAEAHAFGRSRQRLTVLLEGGLPRGAEAQDGTPGRAWERAVLEFLQSDPGQVESVLYLGGGSGTLLRVLGEMSPGTRTHVVERSHELVNLAQAHFVEWGGWDEVALEIGEIHAAQALSAGPFSLTVLDGGALPALGGAPFLTDSDWRRLLETVRGGGTLALGGLRLADGLGDRAPEAILRAAGRWAEEACLYLRASSAGQAPLEGGSDETQGLLLASSEKGRAWPEALGEFSTRLVDGG